MQCSDCKNFHCKVKYRSVCAFDCNLVVTECSVTQRGNITYSLSWTPEDNPILIVSEAEINLEFTQHESSDINHLKKEQFKVA